MEITMSDREQFLALKQQLKKQAQESRVCELAHRYLENGTLAPTERGRQCALAMAQRCLAVTLSAEQHARVERAVTVPHWRDVLQRQRLSQAA